MQLMVIILKNVDPLEELLTQFGNAGIRGATILESTGMASELARSGGEDDLSFVSALRSYLNPEHEKNKTIFTVMQEDQVLVAKNIVEAVVGDLSKPNTGIMFTVPITSIFGGSFK
ncbi:MAG: hypothetical protein ACRDBX_04050 [Erysipelotrichaceae bacterium]